MSPLLAASLLGAGYVPAATVPARAVGIVMTGVVHTDCSAAVSRTALADNGREIDLGLLSRRCNDGEGYKVILHTPETLGGAVLVLQDRRIPLSGNGQTVVIDSDEAERNISQPAHILLPAAIAPGDFPIRLEAVPKGTIY